MKRQLRILLVFVVFNFLFACAAQASLTERVNEVLGRSSQRRVEFSICIVKADTGKTLYEHNARNPLMPASNMKIITTAAALKYLGAEFEYKTKVGIQDSNLVIIGSGDPLFGDRMTDEKYGRQPEWILESIAQAIKDKGVSSIKDIIVDTGIFDNELIHPSWDRNDLNRSWSCEVSGLNYNDNCIAISMENMGGRVSIFTDPQTSFVTLINNVDAVSTGENSWGAYRGTQPNKLTIKGKCSSRVAPFDIAIERPAAFFGCVLGEYLNKNSISI
ncbi:MAG: D-alanyl-D-alanine carboxypeptidase, partial [Sedimentisphaerales bacterium]